jgi:hypothetical protein
LGNRPTFFSACPDAHGYHPGASSLDSTEQSFGQELGGKFGFL